jgi:predicted secreted hydrolase
MLHFPRDHGAHLGAAIEWWYITGDLREPDGRHHGFQITFFRSRTGLAEDLDSRFAARHLLFAHAALTDLGAGTHLHAQRIARWSGDPSSLLARASLQDTDLRLNGWTLQRQDAGGASLYTHAVRQRRTGFRAAAGAARHPAAAAAGRCRLLAQGAGRSPGQPLPERAAAAGAGHAAARGQGVAVSGRAWLDHEWSDS